jgi:hypothetical protein
VRAANALSYRIGLVGIVLLWTCSLLAQITVNVTEIGFDVAVKDSDGNSVSSLSQDDFQLFEDGENRDLVSFERRDTPFYVLVVFDCHSLEREYVGGGSSREISKSSVPKNPWDYLNTALRFVQALKAQQQVAIAVTDWTKGIEIVRDWEDTRAPVQIALDTACGRPNEFAPQSIQRLFSAIATKSQSIPGRKAVVWIGPEWPYSPIFYGQHHVTAPFIPLSLMLRRPFFLGRFG